MFFVLNNRNENTDINNEQRTVFPFGRRNLLDEECIKGHDDTETCNPQGEAFSNAVCFPEESGHSCLVAVHVSRETGVDECAGADEQQNKDGYFGKIKNCALSMDYRPNLMDSQIYIPF